jgi:hypothetical protein
MNARIALLCAAAGIVFFFCADPFLSPPDCASYWAWAEAIARHLNLDFRPYYAKFDMPVFYTYLTPTERLSNDWPMGAGLMLLPTVLFGRHVSQAWLLLLVVGAMRGWYKSRAGAVDEEAQADGAKRGALMGLAAALVGTPLLFYALFGPFFSHLPSFAVTTAFLVLWERTRANRTAAQWLLVGLLLGAATLIRPQNLLLAVVFVAELPDAVANRAATVERRHLITVVLFFAGVVLALMPRFFASAVLYGNPLALPKLDEMHWFAPELGKLLLSDFHGLLPWTPIYAPAFVGVVLLFCRERALCVALLLVLLTQIYINAANMVWWSGGSFGNRRLADSAIVVAYGISALYRSRTTRGWRTGVIAIGILCCGWTLLLLLAERRGLLPLDRYVTFVRAEFWHNLLLVITQPVMTVKSLVRWEPLYTVLVLRAISALLLTTGLYVIVMRQRGKSASESRTVHRSAWAATVIALVLALLTGIAAMRTPRIADPEFRKMLPQTPGVLWDNYIELAFYNLERGRYIPARDAARHAIEMRPKHYSGWWYLGVAEWRLRHNANAQQAFQQVLMLNPEHENAKRALWMLQSS